MKSYDYLATRQLLKEKQSVTTVKYTEWGRAIVGYKKKWKLIERESQNAEFMGKFRNDISEFREHVARVTNQY